MFEKIKQMLVEELQLKESDVTLDSELVNDLGINSLELADLAMTVEEEFNVKIMDDDIRKFITVRDVVDYLESLEG